MFRNISCKIIIYYYYSSRIEKFINLNENFLIPLNQGRSQKFFSGGAQKIFIDCKASNII
jgi:hypothetical protein